MPESNQGSQVQKPKVSSWYSGGQKFLVTYYSYAVENDPFYEAYKQTDLVEVPELNHRKFTRGFLGIDKNGKVLPGDRNGGVTMQGSGMTKDGDYIKYTGGGVKGGKAKFEFGVGGRYAPVSRPFEQIAVDPKVIPKRSKVYVEHYGRVMSADDTGGRIKGNHIDIFVGAKPHKEAVSYGNKYSRIGAVDISTPTGGADIPTQASAQNNAPAKAQNNAPAKTEKPKVASNNASPKQTSANNTGAIKSGCVHIVGSGESLASIASDHKVQGGYQALAAYNGIANPRLIHIGQEIIIPPQGNATASAPKPEIAPNPQAQSGKFIEHTVGSGETLAAIAKKYKVEGGYMAIVNANNMRNPNSLTIGMKLRIPVNK